MEDGEIRIIQNVRVHVVPQQRQKTIFVTTQSHRIDWLKEKLKELVTNVVVTRQ